jgi:hypothetical protein
MTPFGPRPPAIACIAVPSATVAKNRPRSAHRRQRRPRVAGGRRNPHQGGQQQGSQSVDHNLNGHRRPSRKIRQGFGRAGDLAACGPPARLIVTITRTDEVRRAKSRFSPIGHFASFSTQSVRSGWRNDVKLLEMVAPPFRLLKDQEKFGRQPYHRPKEGRITLI